MALNKNAFLRSAAALCVASLLGCSSSDPSGEGGFAEGRVDRFTVSEASAYEYQVYVPGRHRTSKAWPLFVMVHGCGTTADEQMGANQLNELADAEGFLVMYPDNGGGCWKAVFSEPASVHRGAGGEADLIAQMTQEVMKKYNVDPERVYMIGMSSGAFATTATAAAYPDIYAAAGVMAGGGYGMNASCALLPDAIAAAHVPLAIAEMGERARVIPFISLGGTADPLGETPVLGGCSRKAFMEAMATNNRLAGNRYSLDTTSSVRGQVPDGYTWSKEVWRDTSGCLIGERWVIDGMGHFWSGGSNDPQWAEWTDPRGPSASRAAWEFFSRYRKSDTGKDCAESR